LFVVFAVLVGVFVVGAAPRQVDGDLAIQPAQMLELVHVEGTRSTSVQPVDQDGQFIPALFAVGVHGAIVK
jgi:hypothetical protein